VPRRFFGSRRFATRRKRDWLWITNSIALGHGGTSDAAVLLQPNQWQAPSTAFERCTLYAIRGWLSFRQLSSFNDLTGIPALYLAVVKDSLSGFSLAPLNPSNAGAYDGNDIMWTYGMSLGTDSASAVPPVPRQVDIGCNTLQVDIKVKRKMDSSECIYLTAASAGTGGDPAFDVTGILRCLVDRT